MIRNVARRTRAALMMSVLAVLSPAAVSPLRAQAPLPVPMARESCQTPRVWGAGGVLGVAGEIARMAEIGGFGAPRARLMVRSSTDGLTSSCAPLPAPLSALLTPVESESEPDAWVTLLPVRWSAHANTAYPRNANTGAMWTGRGVSTLVSGGAAFRWGMLSAAVAPEIVYQQNSAFDTEEMLIPGFSPFIHVGHGTMIDLPQRHGEDPFWTVTPGQSYVRADGYGVTIGVSSENVRIGPAIRNPLLLSYTAPGFPHLFVGMQRPRSIFIGTLDAQVFWARLRGSDHFDGDTQNDRWVMGGVVLAFEPRGIPGLVLGASRLHHLPIPAEGLTTADFISAVVDVPFSKNSPNLVGNGLAALFARWALPGSRFEAYAEWGRDDYSWDWEHFLKEPDHSQAYALGFQHLVPTGGNWLRLHGELTYLGAAAPLRSGSGAVTFYTHADLLPGHTHRGQLLGAPIGPGADAQFLGADLLTRHGLAGAYVERVRYNANAYYSSWARFYGAYGHDIELTGGVRFARAWRGAHLHALLTYSGRESRDFIGHDGVNWDFNRDHNLGLQLSGSVTPGIPLLRGAGR
jgi:hypothetical protein